MSKQDDTQNECVATRYQGQGETLELNQSNRTRIELSNFQVKYPNWYLNQESTGSVQFSIVDQELKILIKTEFP